MRASVWRWRGETGMQGLRGIVLAVTVLGTLGPLGDAPVWGFEMTRFPGNPILDRGARGEFDQAQVAPRVVIKEGPGSYKMWYEGAPEGNAASVGYATSSDGLRWTKYPKNPVLSPREPWEGGVRGEISPNGVLLEGGIYKMWYHSYLKGLRRIGYATSRDGINWTKYPGNPVLEPGPVGSWDDKFVSEPRVVRVGDTYMMFYWGESLKGTPSRWIQRIGRATSPDGIRWTKDPQPVVIPSQSWEGGNVASPGVIYEGGVFKLWYSVGVNDGLGYAWSRDGITWTKFAGNPILRRSGVPGSCDSDAVGDSVSVYRDGNEYRVMYGGFGLNPKRISICLATMSAELIDESGALRAPTGRTGGATDGGVLVGWVALALLTISALAWSRRGPRLP